MLFLLRSGPAWQQLHVVTRGGAGSLRYSRSESPFTLTMRGICAHAQVYPFLGDKHTTFKRFEEVFQSGALDAVRYVHVLVHPSDSRAAACCLLLAALLLAAFCFLLPAACLLLAAFCLLPAACCLLPRVYCTLCCLLAAACLLQQLPPRSKPPLPSPLVVALACHPPILPPCHHPARPPFVCKASLVTLT